MATFAGASPTEEIKSRIDIVDLIQEYIQLKPGGANWKANCPFHQEKSPSFMVSRDKQIFHCFGCQEGGDIFTFVQKIEGMEFPEALRMLAKKAHVELPSFNPEMQNHKTRLLDAVKSASDYFISSLHDPELGALGRDYLAQRGVNDATAEVFQIGYAPDSWDAMSTALINKGFKPDELFQAGLTIKRDQGTGYYDRFRGRLIFPLKDVHGTIIGFGGRTLKSDETGAKYINSPQSLIYDKGGFLYALDLAKTAIREQKLAVIVEGYMDVVASHQAGVTNVVASSGTALTERQVKLLRRFTSSVALAFDMDLAGTDASQRGIDIALRQELDVRVITLPFGKDPDELIKKDPEAWKKAVSSSATIMDYAFDRATKDKDFSKLEEKKHAVRMILRALTQIPDPLEHAHYLQKLSRLVGVEEQVLMDKLMALKKSVKTPAPASTATESHVRDRTTVLAERILAFLLRFPEEMEHAAVGLSEDDFEDPRHRVLYKAMRMAYTAGHTLQIDEITKTIRTTDPRTADDVARLAMFAEHELETLGEDVVRKDLAETVRSLRTDLCNKRISHVTQLMAKAEREGNDGEVARLSTLHQQLSQEKAELTRAEPT